MNPSSFTDDSPRRRRRGIDLGQGGARLAVLLAAAFLGLAAAAAPQDFVINVDNDAKVPKEELASILKDFRPWAARVYAYNHVEHPAPVTLRLTNDVPFGFYQGDTVLLPPNADRWMMIDDWVHELTHHATGHESSFFFKEGIAVHTLEHLFREAGRTPDTWPQFGKTNDEWVNLFVTRGQMPKLREALWWEGWRGDTPDGDFRSWQIYNIAGSFCGWYIQRFGYDQFRKAFVDEWPAQDSADLQKEWLKSIDAKDLKEFDAATVLPAKNPRYRRYIQRLQAAN